MCPHTRIMNNKLRSSQYKPENVHDLLRHRLRTRVEGDLLHAVDHAAVEDDLVALKVGDVDEVAVDDLLELADVAAGDPEAGAEPPQPGDLAQVGVDLLEVGDGEGLVDHAAHVRGADDGVDVVDGEAEDEVHQHDGHVDDEDDEEQLGHPVLFGERVCELVLPHEHGQDLRNAAKRSY